MLDSWYHSLRLERLYLTHPNILLVIVAKQLVHYVQYGHTLSHFSRKHLKSESELLLTLSISTQYTIVMLS